MKKEIAVVIGLALILITAGCVHPTGCISVTVEGKHTTSTNSLVLTINETDYTYYNPLLDTYSKIEIGKTYSMRFQPMIGGPQAIELCEENK